MEIIYF